MYLGKLYKRTEAKFNLRDMPGNPDTEASITVRLLTPGERQEAADAGFETVYVPADDSGAMSPEVRAQARKTQEFIFRRAVVGWDGLFADAEGNEPLKFGDAGKRLILEMAPGVVAFAAACHGKIAQEANEAREAERKN